jgi:hypothetical protein
MKRATQTLKIPKAERVNKNPPYLRRTDNTTFDQNGKSTKGQTTILERVVQLSNQHDDQV